MNRAIITGATGTVGTAIIQELIKKNVEVLVFCRSDSKRISQIPQSPLVTIKSCSLDELANVENDTQKKYDTFYHLAWEGTTGEARDDYHLQNKNVKYALDAVRAAKRFGCETFIGVGSQAEYGRVEGMIHPDTPTFPTMGYGIGKLSAGLFTRQAAHKMGLKHIWVRILSIYGPNDGAQNIITSTIKKLLASEVPQLTKGDQMWDFLYNEDAAKAFVLLGDKGIDGKTYVLGSGKVRRLREYIEDLRDVVSPKSDLAFGAIDYYPHQVMYLQADIKDLVQDTGWSPTVDFKEGIQKLLHWIQAK